MIEKGKTVSMDYTLTVEGKVFDSSEGKAPLEYVQGNGMIIPGLEKELDGLKVGDKRNVVVTAIEGYGERNEQALVDMPKANFKTEGCEPQVGMMVQGQGQTGQPLTGTVLDVGEEKIKVDFNHPLAGKELMFDIEIKDVK